MKTDGKTPMPKGPLAALLVCVAFLGFVAQAFQRPSPSTRIEDLSASAEPILKKLPNVVDVEVKVQVEKPSHRIIHLRDWHWIPRDSFAIDVRNSSEEEPTEENIDRLYGEFLLQVDAIQTEQLEILRLLIKGHGLKRVFIEGLAAEEMPNYLEKVDVLRDMEQNQVTRLKEQLSQARELKSAEIEQQIVGLLEEHKFRVLEIGAAGRLLLAGEIEEVLPLEDSVLHSNADPTKDGKIQFDRDKVRARNDAQVKAVLDKGPFGLVMLGGAHDLSASVRQHPGCEYVRVTTRRFREVGE